MRQHDEYVNKLYKKLYGKFDVLKKYVKYEFGEMDIYAQLDDYIYYYEVKCTRSQRKKGLEQLKKFRKRFKYEKKHGLLYIGEDDLLEQIF